METNESLISKALEIAGAKNKFVNSVKYFYEKNGFMTDKQKIALKNIRPAKKRAKKQISKDGEKMLDLWLDATIGEKHGVGVFSEEEDDWDYDHGH